MTSLHSNLVSVVALSVALQLSMSFACTAPMILESGTPTGLSSPVPTPTPVDTIMSNKNANATGPISGKASATAESTPFSEIKSPPANSQTDAVRDMNPLNRLPIKTAKPLPTPAGTAPAAKKRKRTRQPSTR